MAHRRNDTNAVQASHSDDVPRFGGVATLCGVCAGAIGIAWTFANDFSIIIVLSALPITLIGIFEDSGFRAPAKYRFFVAIFSASLAIWTLGHWVQRTDIPILEPIFQLTPVAIIFTIIFAGGFCHAVNLTDGMNGLAAVIIISASTGIGIIAKQATLFEIGTMAFALATATLAFAMFNWPKAKLFLGDAGAYGLGHILVWLAISTVALDPDVSVPSVLLVLFWPIADTSHTMLRRFVRHIGIFQPDRMHLHQKIRRCLEIIVIGRKQRKISNPLTTFIMAPFILAPVIFGVLLVHETATAWVVLMACFLLFSYVHILVTRISKTARIRPSADAHSVFPNSDG